MDRYLNSIASAFRQTDAKIASDIEGGLQTYHTSDKALQANRKQGDLVE
ncbi:hypothetical protein ABID29_001026 [Streptococcus rupicaprae]|uniref:Uncharacterized protein n=1 Tax=Streptococcus rupicaprae TaxID=759619 RepID=A0ABV2FH74_9STRE